MRAMGKGMSMSMRKNWALGLMVTGALAIGCAAPSAAQSTRPDRMAIIGTNDDGGYQATKTYSAVRDRVIKAHLLERLRDFFSPIRVPRTVGVLAAECEGGPNTAPFYRSRDRTITVCYQFIALVEKWADMVTAAESSNPKGFPFPITRNEFIWGLIGGVVLHESGHALFDVLDVPVFGREEDAADQFSILIALRLRPQLAEAAVKAYAYFWHMVRDPDVAMKDGNLNTDFADEHGTASQRLYNGLCLAYGHTPEVFGKFVSAGWLPAQRAKGCAREYAQLASAFAKTVLPFIDEKRMAEMEKIDWLAADYVPVQGTPPPTPPPGSVATNKQGGPSGRGKSIDTAR
jgi:hypothetical protein